MDSGNKFSLVDLMKISLIRNKILKEVPTFTDMGNLSKTCKWLSYLIHKENFSRKMVCYNDVPHINVHGIRHGFEFTTGKQNLAIVSFEKDDRYCKATNEAKKFNQEFMISGDCINLSIENSIGELTKDDHQIFTMNMGKEVNELCRLRRDSTTLRFMEYYFVNDYMILHILSHLNHNDLKTIHIPLHSLMFEAQKYEGLKEDIFDGLSKLNELVLFSSPAINGFTSFVTNRNIVNNVLRSFSRKKDSTLVFKDLGCSYELISDYIIMVLEIAAKYGIKIKWDIASTFEFLKSRSNDNCSVGNCSHFPLESLVSSFSCNLREPNTIINILENLRTFKNLETLNLRIFLSNFEANIKKMGRGRKSLSLQNCKTLKQVIFDFKEHLTVNADTDIGIIHNDLKYLISLMPNTIQRLEINNFSGLTKEITEFIDKCMPNIKTVIVNNVTYKDVDCLCSFKNLLAYISLNNCSIQIPETVQLVAIGNSKKWYYTNDSSVNKEQLVNYSIQFSRNLYNDRGDNIFFNDLDQWDMYKSLLMKKFII